MKISVHKPWNKQPRKLFWAIWIIMTPWKQLLKLCSAQEAVYHNLPKLQLLRIFLTVYSVNINVPKKGIQALLCEKELREVQDDSTNIFKSNISYLEWPSATFCIGKYSQTCSNDHLLKTTNHLRWPMLSPPKPIPIQSLLYKTTTCLTQPVTTFLFPKWKKTPVLTSHSKTLSCEKWEAMYKK